jgi:mRNA interferase RelE/StbE
MLALRGVIRSLAPEPRPPGVRKLEGSDHPWRLRVRVDQEQWRIVYQLRDHDQLVIVLRAARRNEATYRRLG